MGEKLVQAGTVLAAFTAVALVVFGASRVLYGTGSFDEAIGFLFLAVAVIGSYRSFAIHPGPQVNALGNTALFAAAVGAYGGGINFEIDPATTVGQALFAIAVGYFLIRRH